MAGRPSPIDAIVGRRDDGTQITVADRIVAGLSAGNYFEHACAAAGVTKETGYEWLRVAGRALIRAKGRPIADLDLSPHDRRCVAFSDAVAEAESTWVVTANATLERLGRGGQVLTTTTIKRGPSPGPGPDGQPIPGPVLETSTRTEELAPNPQVIEWRLTRRFPSLYGNRLELLAPGDALSSEERAAELLTGIEGFLEHVDAAVKVRTSKPRAKKPAAT